MFKFLIVPLAALTVSFAAQAQSPDSKERTKEEAVKAPKSKPADTKPKADEHIDLDAFFKSGEENAKKGSSCRAPEEPIA